MDARVVRTRRALLDAAVELVEEKDDACLSITDIAGRAGVSRQVVYDHFADRDHLLAEAGIRRWRDAISEAEDGPTRIPADGSPPLTLVALVAHFVEHRRFYYRLFTGPSSSLVLQGLDALYRYHFERMMRLPGSAGESESEQSELITFLAGGSMSLILWWSSQDPPQDDVHGMADRLWRLWTSVRPVASGPGTA